MEARNPRDVFVLDADKVWSSERLLAGYLGLGGTAELNALPDLPANQLILKQYHQARASGFGGRSKTDKANWLPSDIFRALEGDGQTWLPLTTLPLPLAIPTVYRGPFSWLVAMRMLLVGHPGTMVQPPRYNALVPVHWHHMETGTEPTCSSNGIGGRPRRVGNPAQRKAPPGHRRTRRSQCSTMTPKMILSADNKQSDFALEDAGLDEETIAWAEDNQRQQEKMYGLLSKEELTRPANDDNFEHTLQDILHEHASVMPTVREQYEQGRRVLNATDQANVIDLLRTGVKVIFPTPDDTTPIVPSTKDIRKLARAATESSNRASCQSERLQDGLQAELTNRAIVEGDALGSADDVLDEKRKQFWDFQNRINASSASAPAYVNACEALGISDPERPSIWSAEVTWAAIAPARKEKEQCDLLPHQVQAITWALDLFRSDLHGLILADEMGLGKTVFALALLIFWQRLESSTDGSAPPAGAEEGSQGSILSTDNMQHEQPLPPDSPHQPRSQQIGIDIPATEESEAEHDGDDEEDGGEAHEDPASTNDRATSLKRRTAQAIRMEAKINQAKSLIRGIANRKYKATLILAPSHALGVWKEEIRTFFPMLTLKQFYSAQKRSAFEDRGSVLGTSIVDLLEFLDGLPDDPSTLGVAILSSYATWAKRSTWWDEETLAARADASGRRTRHASVGQEDDDADAEDGELAEEELNRAHSCCPGVFRIVIADEAQKLKSIQTVAHKSVLDLQAAYHVFLTATPMIYRPRDLAGLLTLMWREEWADRGPASPTLDDYEEAKSLVCGHMLSTDNINQSLWLLNPAVYKVYATPDRESGGLLQASTANQYIPPILNVIQLKRTSATTIEDVASRGSYRIGAEIPPVRWVTVELQMGPQELEKYARIHHACTRNLSSGYAEGPGTGLRNMAFHETKWRKNFDAEVEDKGGRESRVSPTGAQRGSSKGNGS